MVAKMDMRSIAEQIRQISESQNTAGASLSNALHGSLEAFNGFESAYRAAVTLQQANTFVGATSEELHEVIEHLGLVRELVAELIVALTDLLGDESPVRIQLQRDLADVAPVARDGMQKKRLAHWEAQALRSAVVDALAGPTGASK